MSIRNPWVTIWTRPRATVAAIIKRNPAYHLWVLAGLSGLPFALQFFRWILLERSYPLSFLLVIAILSFVIGTLIITLMSLLFFWAGKWVGGKADFSAVRVAVAWANVPNLILIFLLILLLFKQGHFNWNSFNIYLGFIQWGISIWSLIILLIGISQAEEFSVGRAMITFFLASIIIPIAICLAVFGFLLLLGITGIIDFYGELVTSIFRFLIPFRS